MSGRPTFNNGAGESKGTRFLRMMCEVGGGGYNKRMTKRVKETFQAAKGREESQTDSYRLQRNRRDRGARWAVLRRVETKERE